jgi:hypothetical protein
MLDVNLMYVDPGSGALLWQLLLGMATGVLYQRRRVFAWLTRFKRGKNERS